jgi:hypothetical protein
VGRWERNSSRTSPRPSNEDHVSRSEQLERGEHFVAALGTQSVKKAPQNPLFQPFWRPTPRPSEEKLLHLRLVLFRREIARETHFTKILFHCSFPAHLNGDMHGRGTFMTIVALHFYFSNVLNPFLISDHPGISALMHWLLVPNWNGMTFHLSFRPSP